MHAAACVRIGDALTIGRGCPLAVIAGPCVIESEAHALALAANLRDTCAALAVPLLFKASFDKANRTSIDSFRGPGLVEGLRILARIRREVGVPILTDVHLPEQVEAAAEVVDCLQIPAFLARQTDLLLAAGRASKPVNVKKAQYMAPEDMAHVVEKIRSTGDDRVLLTERGTSFGYRNLVVDFRGLTVMRRLGHPVLFDATHSVQTPGGMGDSSGGAPEFIAALARAAVAVGVDAVFVEVHDDPARALSDGANALPLEQFTALITQLRDLSDHLASRKAP